MGLKDDSNKGSEPAAAELADRAIDKARRGRKDRGQESEPDEKKLREVLPGVVKLLKAKIEADAAFSKKVKAAAGASGFMAVVVRAAAKALNAEPETREKDTRQAEQMELAFGVVEKMAK